MPPRGQPSARQVRLGAELRKLREQAGMTSAQAAASLGWERPQISHIESGRWGVSSERVRHLSAHYSARDMAYIDALAAMSEDHTRGWWSEFRGTLPASALDLAELEHHARYLRTVQTVIIPGLLQTEDYARSVFSGAITRRPAAEIDAAVRHRMTRRCIFARPAPPEFEVFLHESSLRMRYGNREVMCSQLEFLEEVADWPTVAIRVIPFDVEDVSSSLQFFTYAGGPVPQLDTVQVDNAFYGTFLDSEAQLGKYRALLKHVKGISLGVGESRKLVKSVRQEM